MFDSGWPDVPAAVLDTLAPPEDEPAVWEAQDFDAWIDHLAETDPDRPRAPGEVLAAVERGRLDPALGARLAAIDPATLDDDERISLAVAAARWEAHLAGVKARAVAAFAGPAPRDDRDVAAFAWCEVSAALRIGERTARSYVDDVRHLAARLPATLTAVIESGLSWSKARALIDATRMLTVEQCRAVEERVLPDALARTARSHSDAVARAVRRVDPNGWRRRREDKLADVALVRCAHGDGVADLLLRNLDSYRAQLVWTAADTWARARKAEGDERTLDALRVEALVEFSRRYLADGDGVAGDSGAGGGTGGSGGGSGGADGAARPRPTRNGEPAVVNVVIGLPELISGTGVATIAGTGDPLPAEAVAELLRAGARIRFALIDAAGHLTGVSTKLHDPTALMRVFVALRDLTARTPSGSAAPVAGQDLDHLDPHGGTHPGNLHAPTRGWHRAKTFGHWTLNANADGTIAWTSRRTGRTYTTHPYNFRDGP